jgi:hypothetical protein
VASTPNWNRVAAELECALPQTVSKRRRNLLPKILEEWSQTDLREHLSRESRAVTRERLKKLELVRDRAKILQEAMGTLEGDDVTALVAQLLMTQGQRAHEFNREELRQKSVDLDQHFRFLAELSEIKPRSFWKLGRGQPPNLQAYLVLQDAAAIYEWITGETATRNVDRYTGTDVSPFFQFASVLWPIIFGKDTSGLKAAMKNWAKWRKDHDERSAFVVNVALRHPDWGLFEGK